MTTFQKFLIGAVILLILINSVLLGFIWLNRPDRTGNMTRKGHHDRGGMELTGRRLLSELDFNQEQAIIFKKEAKDHLQTVSTISSRLRRSRHQINRAILTGDTLLYKQADSTHRFSQMRLDQESQDFMRFLDSVCTPKQKRKLIEMNEETMRRRP